MSNYTTTEPDHYTVCVLDEHGVLLPDPTTDTYSALEYHTSIQDAQRAFELYRWLFTRPDGEYGTGTLTIQLRTGDVWVTEQEHITYLDGERIAA